MTSRNNHLPGRQLSSSLARPSCCCSSAHTLQRSNLLLPSSLPVSCRPAARASLQSASPKCHRKVRASRHSRRASFCNDMWTIERLFHGSTCCSDTRHGRPSVGREKERGCLVRRNALDVYNRMAPSALKLYTDSCGHICGLQSTVTEPGKGARSSMQEFSVPSPVNKRHSQYPLFSHATG